MEDVDVVHYRLLLASLQSLVKTEDGFGRDITKMRNNPAFFVTCRQLDQAINDGREKGDPAVAKVFEENFTMR
jgi:hypothetical protein